MVSAMEALRSLRLSSCAFAGTAMMQPSARAPAEIVEIRIAFSRMSAVVMRPGAEV
jgi:hypothetical protein